MAHHAAEVAAHEDVVEGGQFQVGGPQVPGQLQTFAVGNTAAPVRRAQRTRAGGAFIWRQRGEEPRLFQIIRLHAGLLSAPLFSRDTVCRQKKNSQQQLI